MHTYERVLEYCVFLGVFVIVLFFSVLLFFVFLVLFFVLLVLGFDSYLGMGLLVLICFVSCLCWSCLVRVQDYS